jgi:hypothetical protein
MGGTWKGDFGSSAAEVLQQQSVDEHIAAGFAEQHAFGGVVEEASVIERHGAAVSCSVSRCHLVRAASPKVGLAQSRSALAAVRYRMLTHSPRDTG